MKAVRYGIRKRRSTALHQHTLCAAAGALLLSLACSDTRSDDGIANYYLNGRVVDGSTMAPLAEAQLTLSVGENTKTTRSSVDGSFLLGPIAPDSDYRISAKLEGYDAFLFYGSRLPHLDNVTDRDRGLLGDVQLYSTGGQTPAFTISASSRDASLPLDESSSELRFVPARLGIDPAQRAAAADATDAGAEDLSNTFLPNDAVTEIPSYGARLLNGAALIPAGALHWGAGYNLEVYGGPSFDTERTPFASGQASDMSIWLSPNSTALGTDLTPDTAEYFTGRIYDGVSLARLTNYKIRLEYFDHVIPGTVDENGRYFVGPLLAKADYSIVVEADGYRSFLSHNERLPEASAPSLTSLYYDAFLYPNDISTPGAVCRVRVSDSTALPSGFMRFEPRGSSSLFDTPAELPVGVTSTGSGRQLWENDEDLQQRSLLFSFDNGEVDIPSGQLVYGVNYEVTIYGVSGHQTVTGNFTAGVDGAASWVVNPLSTATLAVTALSTDSLIPTPNGRLEILFNQPIALDPRVNLTTIQRALNDNFAISSPDEDQDATQNVLVDPSSLTPPVPAAYRGISFQIDNDRLILSWDSKTALGSSDADDPINSVTYGGLSSIMLYAAGQQSPAPVALSSLLGSGSSSVLLVAQ